MSERIARAKVGDRRACRICDADIEFWGKKVGWIDRGGNRFCTPSMLVHPPNMRRLHRPNE